MDKLRKFLNSLNRTEQDAFAALVGTSIGYLRKAISTGATPRPELCVAIERAASGVVTRRDLRPHDWRMIWPELEGNSSQSATQAAEASS